MPADRAESVEHFATKIQPSDPFAFECFGIDLAERDAAAGDFRLLVALVAVPREGVGRQRVDQREALGPFQAAGASVERDAGPAYELVTKAGGRYLATMAETDPPSLRLPPSPMLRRTRRGASASAQSAAVRVDHCARISVFFLAMSRERCRARLARCSRDV